MESQNKKERKKYEKEERKRLFELVNIAYTNDPRIKEAAAKELAAKDLIKQAKKDAR
jgi:hypothetical protein